MLKINQNIQKDFGSLSQALRQEHQQKTLTNNNSKLLATIESELDTIVKNEKNAELYLKLGKLYLDVYGDNNVEKAPKIIHCFERALNNKKLNIETKEKASLGRLCYLANQIPPSISLLTAAAKNGEVSAWSTLEEMARKGITAAWNTLKEMAAKDKKAQAILKKLSPSTFENLPADMIRKIFSSLSPEDAFNARVVNTTVREALTKNADLFWEKKFQQHFPNIYKIKISEKDIDWRKAFLKTYNNEYKDLSLEVKKLYSLIKENTPLIEIKNYLTKNKIKLDDIFSPALLPFFDGASQAVYDSLYRLVRDKYLITNRNTVDTKKIDKNQLTILGYAVLFNQSTEIIKLLSQGANINSPAGPGGATPLLLAIKNDCQEVVSTLLTHHADTSIALTKNHDYHKQFKLKIGDTPLNVAIKLGKTWAVKALLEAGAAITDFPDGNKPLHYAARHGHAAIVDLLIQYKSTLINSRLIGATPLLFAIENNHEDVVKVLLKHNANTSIPLAALPEYLNHHDKFNVQTGDTPLHAAIKLGKTWPLKALLDAGAIITDFPDGKKPLNYAAEYGLAEIAELLIQHGADINCLSRLGATPLLFAIEHNHENVVKVLLKYKADTSIALRENNKESLHNKFNVVAGDTPLHVAAKLGSDTLIHLLLEHNANTQLLNSKQQKPQDVANKNSRYGAQSQLLAYQKRIDDRVKTKGTDHKSTSYTFFGKEHSYGYTAGKKQAAVVAAIQVYVHNADPSILDEHKGALENGELDSIISRLKSSR